jgi:hypothetical protein
MLARFVFIAGIFARLSSPGFANFVFITTTRARFSLPGFAK